MKFQACLDALLNKEAGLLEKIKDVALTEVAGTKPWLIGRNAKAPVSEGLRGAARKASGTSGVRTAVRGSAGPGSQRVYDVSEQARKMGIV